MKAASPSRTMVLITVYKERSHVEQLIESLRRQTLPISKVLIVDNSPVAVFPEAGVFHAEGLDEMALRIEYRPENIGISGAIDLALQVARAEHCQYLWFMDHDSVPSTECHEVLVGLLKQESNAAMAACLPMIQPQNEPLHGLAFKNYRFVPMTPATTSESGFHYECDAVITSGSLLAVGRLPGTSIINRDLFIDAVDHDLCWRIRTLGLKILVAKKALMSHRLGEAMTVHDRSRRRTILISSYSFLRLYYICRNHTIVEVQAAQGLWKLVAILWRTKFCVWQIRMNFLEGRGAVKKSAYCILGLLHGLLGRAGKHPLSQS